MTIHGETIASSGMDRTTVNRAPVLGEHTEYVLQKPLGMDEGEVHQFHLDGALQQRDSQQMPTMSGGRKGAAFWV